MYHVPGHQLLIHDIIDTLYNSYIDIELLIHETSTLLIHDTSTSIMYMYINNICIPI